jgi:hypothetical protein
MVLVRWSMRMADANVLNLKADVFMIRAFLVFLMERSMEES